MSDAPADSLCAQPPGNATAAKIGGPDQVRTDDLLNAIEALFQLSYEPIAICEG